MRKFVQTDYVGFIFYSFIYLFIYLFIYRKICFESKVINVQWVSMYVLYINHLFSLYNIEIKI